MAYPTIPTVPPVGGEPSATLQTAAAADGNGTPLNVVGMSTVALTIKTTGYSGTITFKVSENGTDYVAVLATEVGTTTVATNTGALTTDTSTSCWQAEVGGMQSFIAALSSTSAGSVTITAHASFTQTAAVPISSTVGTVTQSTASSLKTLASQASSYPSGATPLTADSGNIGAGTATATLAATSGKTTYITGYQITSTGSTSAAVVTGTITGTITGTLHFTYATVAGATLSNQPLIVPLPYPIPASATNTTIAVALPSLGTGNTNTTVSAYGFQL